MHCQSSITLSLKRRWPVHSRNVFYNENLSLETVKTFKTNYKETTVFFCTTILLLSPLYIIVYTRRVPIALAIVEVMPRGRVMYSNTNKHPSSTLR